LVHAIRAGVSFPSFLVYFQKLAVNSKVNDSFNFGFRILISELHKGFSRWEARKQKDLVKPYISQSLIIFNPIRLIIRKAMK